MSSIHVTTPVTNGHRPAELSLDDLPLRDAVISDGLVLVPGRHLEVALYALDHGYVRCLGTFDDPAHAWASLDALDQS